MPKFVFHIALKDAHGRSGKTAAIVARATGLSANTVQKYAQSNQTQRQIAEPILTLCAYYGVPFHEAVTIKQIETE